MTPSFTKEEIEALYAPFPLNEHITREGNTVRDGQGIQWFSYIDRAAVQRRLEKLFPGEWSVDMIETYRDAKYVTVSLKMTIRGVSRSCNGGQSLNGGSMDEDKEKGAWTEAFRRVASVWGIGLYLYESDFKNYTDNYVDANRKKDWKKRDAVQTQAENQFSQWYNRQFKPSNGNHAPPPAERPTVPPSQNGTHGDNGKTIDFPGKPATPKNAPPAPEGKDGHPSAMLMLGDLIDSPDLKKLVPQDQHRRALVNLLAKHGLFANCETTPDMMANVNMYIEARAKGTDKEKTQEEAIAIVKATLERFASLDFA